MLDWLDGNRNDKARLAPKFNGSIASLIDRYETDEDSAFQNIQENTQEGYKPWLKMIRETVGNRSIYKVKPKDFRRWYKAWKERSSTRGTDGVRSAYGGVQMLRVILNYGAEDGIKKCLELRAALDRMKFAKNPARTVIVSFDQVEKFLEEAWKRNEPFMALTQALQYECLLRQNDIIGKCRKIGKNYKSMPGDVATESKYWRGMTMDMVQLDKALVVQTSKTGKPVVHALPAYRLVIACLEKIDAGTNGPVAQRKDGSPWPDRQSFSRDWREIARAAGIPDNVKNMDSRASGVTEASKAGVSDDDIIKQTGHVDKVMVQEVYTRDGLEVSRRSHEQRQRHHEARRQAGAP